MPTQLQLRRGTQAQNDTFVGANGEIIVDLTNKTLRLHDGVTTGGWTIANSGAPTFSQSITVSSTFVANSSGAYINGVTAPNTNDVLAYILAFG